MSNLALVSSVKDQPQPAEIQLITKLTGVASSAISFTNVGFWSRVYLINQGEIVFKFRKSPKVSYRTEIKALNFLNTLNLGVNLQKVGWVSPDDTYLGLYGIVGHTLDVQPDTNIQPITQPLARALHILHQASLHDAETCHLATEIQAWQTRYREAGPGLAKYFSAAELQQLDQYIMELMPGKLTALGEKLVLSHGDLSENNLIVNQDTIGIIDFNELSYLDEAADFMDLTNTPLTEALLHAYNANSTLHQKVQLRRELRPLIVFGGYLKRHDDDKINQLVRQIRQTILS